MILIMIGSNDLLNMSPASCENVGIRLRHFLSTLCDCIPEHVQRMVLVAPPKMSLGDWTDSVIVNESNKFGTVYEAIASEKGLTFLNACEWDLPLCYDGVHLTEEAHLHFCRKNHVLFTVILPIFIFFISFSFITTLCCGRITF